MRQVRFFKDSEDFVDGEVKLFTKYGNLKASFMLNARAIPLPLSKKGEYYTFETYASTDRARSEATICEAIMSCPPQGFRRTLGLCSSVQDRARSEATNCSDIVERFFVCEGEGELYYRDCEKFYDFRDIDICALDCYMAQGVIPTGTSQAQRRLIRDFMRVYDLNIKQNALYLNPLGFEEAEQSLLC